MRLEETTGERDCANVPECVGSFIGRIPVFHEDGGGQQVPVLVRNRQGKAARLIDFYSSPNLFNSHGCLPRLNSGNRTTFLSF